MSTGIDTSTLLSQKNTLCRVDVIVQLGERFYSIHGYGTIFESSINSVGRVLVLWVRSPHGKLGSDSSMVKAVEKNYCGVIE